jgi:hypothetical protein
MRRLTLVVLFVLFVAVAGFVAGLRAGRAGIDLRSLSPDGRRVAEVGSSWTIDPPAQSIWLRPDRRGAARKLADLAGDVDWCDAILWSPDGERGGVFGPRSAAAYLRCSDRPVDHRGAARSSERISRRAGGPCRPLHSRRHGSLLPDV